jgi:hypothetical protein
MHKRSFTEKSDTVPVQPSLLVVSALLIPVLVAAFILLYLFPESLGADYFAWPINPLMSSMMLGATYLGGAYFFMIVVLFRQWRHVWLGFLPVTVFAATLGIATLLHWEPFAHDRFGFVMWVFLYFTVPLILPVMWYRNQRLAAHESLAREGDLPQVSRWAFGVLGVIMVIVGLLLFFFPEQMLATWPWTLTPLTARTISAMFLLPGLVGLSLAYDSSWSGARYLLQAQAFSIILMLIAVYVARANFDWEYPTSWLFVGGLSLILLLIAYTYVVQRSERANG